MLSVIVLCYRVIGTAFDATLGIALILQNNTAQRGKMADQLTELPWLSPRNDVVFKILFGQHKDILQRFLEQVLDLDREEYRGIKLIDTHQRSDPDTKLTILDLKLETGTGKVIDVEIQLLLMSSLTQRILYYLSQMLVEQLKPGQKYSSLKRVISVLILNEEMFPQDSLLHHRFRFADQNAGIEWTDLMEVNVLELPKAKRKKTIDSPLDAWLKFLAADSKEDFMQVAEHDAGVRSACMALKDLSADEQTRLAAEMREKAWRDEMDRLDGAKAKGRTERDQEHVKNMYEDGLAPDQIAKYLRLDLSNVKGILNIQ